MNLKKTAVCLMAFMLLMAHLLLPADTAAAAKTLAASQVELEVDRIMKEDMERLHIPGATVVVTSGQKILFSKGYGFADLERQTAMNPDKTLIRIGSLVKSVTATAAMQLVEQGKLDLRKDVNNYLPGFQISNYKGLPITLHDLLTHTAGLDELIYGVNAYKQADTISSGAYLKRYFKHQPPVRAPGEEYAYSNAGLGLVGVLVEQASGMTLSEYMDKNIFQPMEMPNASLSVDEQKPDVAKSYVYAAGKYQPLPFSHINLPGAGGLNVIPNEFAHYMITHLNEGKYRGNTLLNPETITMMHDKQFAEHPLVDGLGYGFFRGTMKNGLLKLWHTGDIDGFSAEMALIPSHGIGIFVVINSANSGHQILNKVVDGIGNILPGTPVGQAAGTPPPEDLHIYEREYKFAKVPQHGYGKWLEFLGRTFKVKANGEALTVTGIFPDGSGQVREKTYTPIAQGLFQEKGGNEQIFFHQMNGMWKMTFIGEVTMNEVTSFWEEPQTLLGIYLGTGIVWAAILVIALLYSFIAFFRKRWKPGILIITAMAALFVIFLLLQLSYGNSEVITYGYPIWYALGICSLPFLAAGLGVYMLVRSGAEAIKGKASAISRCAIALLSLSYTAYLFYWNLLSIHYS
ncbi:serine hydrolase domain-containing protein [Paenibacillus azoreducens]|uniref:Beta-lactamase-related domain-containing protein n=1 Tax=Paenibacillus azoreducens TaxID=116718 RepID=A0A920CQP9_9BACL|nr:serine hydrolase domain-containing protein [Paenibacillus azoreducens]GIO46269.1 hypothetical protein J34TS1_10340 [Paenibacillus azoreducens]